MFVIQTITRSALAIVLATALTACAAAKGGTLGDKRADAQRMRDETLSMFYAKVPSMRGELAKAAGYGVFSGLGTQSIVVATGNGFGIIHDNATGQDTYMRALKLGGGLGVGASDVRAVVVFHDRKTMHEAMTQGWGVTGGGEAAAKVGETGDAASAVVTLPGMSIYRFTRNGVMLGGSVQGVKIWPDDEMNSN